MATIWSPGSSPARAAGDPRATATTRGSDMTPKDRSFGLITKVPKRTSKPNSQDGRYKNITP